LVRTATVVLGGGLAWAVRTERLKISTQLKEVDALLSQLPAPWLMVDSSSNILQASQVAVATLGMSLSKLQSVSFSYLFFPTKKKGDFIQIFLKVVDHHQGVSGLELFCRQSGHAFFASMAPLTTPRGTMVLVVLSPKKSP
jgi:PAS domain-containing protein